MNDLPNFGMQYMRGMYPGPDAPSHCRGCGRPMVVSSRHAGFNPMTGEEVRIATARCPMPMWLRMLTTFRLRFHDYAEQDRFGAWPWVG